MTNIAEHRETYAGVDTHADTHHAAIIDQNGKHLVDAQFPTTPAGYTALTAFILMHGVLVRVGIEGTGSYGAGLARHLTALGHHVIEVIRPNRQLRRINGKSDPVDAYAAARTALTQTKQATPKSGDGNVEQIRYLVTARRSAIKARVAAQVQIKSLLVTAPVLLRERFREVPDETLITRLADLDIRRYPENQGVVIALRALARRHRYIAAEIHTLDQELKTLTECTNPALLAAQGVGPVTAAQLLITGGDNTGRLRSEAAFAALCGVSPIPASSGKTSRHRLNRGGDRHANSALHRIALVRMSYEPRTKAYVEKKRSEGKSNKEIIRCLKRAIAREVFTLLTKDVEVPRVDDLRPLRQALGVTLQQAGTHFNVWLNKISRIERGLMRDDELALAYREWLETTAPTN
ncbi:Mobile element protein [Leucobacter sp. 7(1)]|uniref:IS110 family transposase n=1 Tax=Leucobacter sp. 7(1) TaxID=1255613 RepID=UPI00097F5071|nr:IS110 family transposase [Leucobacter sp. 7(1)]SJN09521.1 Mobile element protein [Leucobacter sp. 7(1)]